MQVPDQQNWSSELKRIVVPEFDGNAGPTKVPAAVKKEVDFFNLIFPSDLYHVIAEQTNLYAQQKQAQNDNDPKYRVSPKNATCLTYYNLAIKAPKLLTADSFESL